MTPCGTATTFCVFFFNKNLDIVPPLSMFSCFPRVRDFVIPQAYSRFAYTSPCRASLTQTYERSMGGFKSAIDSLMGSNRYVAAPSAAPGHICFRGLACFSLHKPAPRHVIDEPLGGRGYTGWTGLGRCPLACAVCPTCSCQIQTTPSSHSTLHSGMGLSFIFFFFRARSFCAGRKVARVWLTRSHFVMQGTLGELARGSGGSSDSACCSQEVGGGP